MIIGLGHRARSGKDMIADHLVNNYGFHRLAFGEPMKLAAELLFGLSPEQTRGGKKEVTDLFWGMSGRVILQKLGMALRNEFDEEVWVRILKRKLLSAGTKNFVIPDVRFLAEAKAIKEWGGQLWRVDRQNALQVAPHVSEVQLADWDGWDELLDNSGTIKQTLSTVDCIMRDLGGKP